ncbi:MAG: hypothetical protein RDV48_28065 [Candidatus Eremiobacteraeota bacterium]|nr:hypothetical protein [Candidatus Eremiobacteraeota bacterium]
MKKVALILLFIVLTATCSWARVAVVGNLTHDHDAKPGDSYDGMIICRNDGDTPSDVKVYQTDYQFFYDGRNTYGEAGKMARSNAKWISISPMRLTVAPKETAAINYTITVPKDDALNGSYWSMIMVEPIAETAPEVSPEKGKIKVGLQTIVRYGIQISTNIADSGEKKLRFIDKQLVLKDNQVALQLDLENNGERTLIPAVWTELYSGSGAYVGRFESGKYRIYPGCSVRHLIDLSGVPKGDYKALVVADNGDENVFGAEYNISIK